MYGEAAYGRTLTAAEARPILNNYGVTRSTFIGPDGMKVNYNGEEYWILEYEITFPRSTPTSPDGKHFVYAPSQEEQDINKPPEGFEWGKVLTLAAWGIGAYVAVNLMGFFKK